jgi:hypothetical protein
MIICQKRPVDCGLPDSHTEWRKGQLESINYCLEENDPIKLLCCPTGSGKTGIIRAVASQYPVMALVRSKSLQSTIYGQTYGFNVLFGRANYSCPHPYSQEGDTAATCLYDGEKMSACPESGICPYLLAKEAAKRSYKSSTNYSYYCTAQWPRRDPAVFLFLDECHCLPEVILDFVGCRITHKDIKEWYLGNPPEIKFSEGMSLFHTVDPCQTAVIYLRECIRAMHVQMASLKKHMDSKYNGPTVKRRLAHGQNVLRNLQSTVEAIQSAPHEWFIVSGAEAVTGRSGGQERGFVATPLTSRYHFPSLFLNSPYTVLLSGTIGSFETFATELGIKQYASRRVESNFPPEIRPIQVLDVPSLSYKSTEKDYEHQADAIAKAILECPLDWSGVIHITRKREATLLAARLAHRGLQDRVWPVPDVPTDKQLEAWADRKKQSSGALAITWSWVEGVDLVDERINICAKLAWPDISDPFERARMNYSRSFYQLRTAWSVQQALGRTRRGEDEDYDLNGQREQLVGIADGSWVRLKRFFDQDFLESIQEVK